MHGKPAATAYVRKNNGWFGPLDAAPDMPADTTVVSEADVDVYSESLTRNGFFGPCSYCTNHEANGRFAQGATNGGAIDVPVLFLHARYDNTCETVDSQLAEPMRKLCANLTEEIVDSGHWMAQEQPVAVNRAISRWLTQQSLIG